MTSPESLEIHRDLAGLEIFSARLADRIHMPHRSTKEVDIMRQLLLSLTAACLALTLASCSEEAEPPEVEPIKNHFDKANAAADAANKAAVRTDRLSAAADGTQDDGTRAEEHTEDDDP